MSDGYLFHLKMVEFFYEIKNKNKLKNLNEIAKIKSNYYQTSRKFLSNIVYLFRQILGMLLASLWPLSVIYSHEYRHIGNSFILSMLFVIFPYGIILHFVMARLRKVGYVEKRII